MIGLFLLTLLMTILVGLYVKLRKIDSKYFEGKGLKSLKLYPVIGSNWYMFQKKNILQVLVDMYNAYPNEKIIGGFDFFTPVYIVCDPKLTKLIVVKDFDHFTDRRSFTNPENDEIFGHVLTAMKGEKWKEMRSSLSPAFTGSKMRLMFSFVADCCQQMVEYFKNDYSMKGVSQVYDVKDTFSRYTNDVVASCAFGVKCDSLKDPENDFYKTGQLFLEFQKPFIIFKFMLLRFFPKLCKMFNITTFDGKVIRTFKEVILGQMKVREENHIIRPDMINLLMELKKGNLQGDPTLKPTKVKANWSDNELVAQSLLFFLAGFETTSTFLQFLAYELAVNPSVQERLIEEVDSIREELQGASISYEAIQKTKYMDAVINETLRMWPPGPGIDRLCVKDYLLDDGEGLHFTIKKGEVLSIPIYAYHQDPKYFPDPKKFDPDRFLDESKRLTSSDSFLPFGIGPRNCIGSRFAIMEIKAFIFYLLSDFTFEVCEETQVPFKLKQKVLRLIPEKKIMLAFTSRK